MPPIGLMSGHEFGSRYCQILRSPRKSERRLYNISLCHWKGKSARGRRRQGWHLVSTRNISQSTAFRHVGSFAGIQDGVAYVARGRGARAHVLKSAVANKEWLVDFMVCRIPCPRLQFAESRFGNRYGRQAKQQQSRIQRLYGRAMGLRAPQLELAIYEEKTRMVLTPRSYSDSIGEDGCARYKAPETTCGLRRDRGQRVSVAKEATTERHSTQGREVERAWATLYSAATVHVAPLPSLLFSGLGAMHVL